MAMYDGEHGDATRWWKKERSERVAVELNWKRMNIVDVHSSISTDGGRSRFIVIVGLWKWNNLIDDSGLSRSLAEPNETLSSAMNIYRARRRRSSAACWCCLCIFDETRPLQFLGKFHQVFFLLCLLVDLTRTRPVTFGVNTILDTLGKNSSNNTKPTSTFELTYFRHG